MKITVTWAGVELAIRIYFFSVACIPLIIWAEYIGVLDTVLGFPLISVFPLNLFFCNRKIRATLTRKNGNRVFDCEILWSVTATMLQLHTFTLCIKTIVLGLAHYIDNSFAIQSLLQSTYFLYRCSHVGIAFTATIGLRDILRAVLNRWKPKQIVEPLGVDVPTEVDPCAVCKENQRQICLPCGHFIMCFGCYNSVKVKDKTCPVCRKTFKEGIRVFQN